MTGAATASRSTVIFLICMPLAVFMGYMLAEPNSTNSQMLGGSLLAVMCLPLFMRWHHPLLIFSCNAIIIPWFMPGKPLLWVWVALGCLFLMLVDRAMSKAVDFFVANKVSYSLIFLLLVAFLTAYANGTSFGSLSSTNSGGKRYVYILAASAVYFALSANPIPIQNAYRTLALYFLSSLTSLVGFIALFGGPAFYFLVVFFPINGTLIDSLNDAGEISSSASGRYGAFSSASIGLFYFLMAVYGVRGVMEIRKPWRMLFLLLAVVGCLFSGFRSNILLIAMTFTMVFIFEGLLKTRYFLYFSAMGLLFIGFLFAFSDRLPSSVQRSISFLPFNVDYTVRQDAEGSSSWRLDMWHELVPMIPTYLIKGRGYGISADEVALAQQRIDSGLGRTYEVSILTGDYHNGPLSVIIPLGLGGTIAFLWFLAAALRVLYLNYAYGNPALKTANTFIISQFLAQTIYFMFVFGSFYSDFIAFAGLAGLSVGLNGGVAQPPPKPQFRPAKI